jgi:hypothetical protein
MRAEAAIAIPGSGFGLWPSGFGQGSDHPEARVGGAT